MKNYERVQGIVVDTRYLMYNYIGTPVEQKRVLAKCIERVLSRPDITPAMLNSINHDLPEYYGRIVEGLRLAVTHQNDAEKKEILAELENTVELNWIREMLK